MGMRVQWIGGFHFTWMTQIQFLTPHMVTRAPPGVIPEHRAKNKF